MKSQVRTQPAGFAVVGVFFFFGAAMACYAAVTLCTLGHFWTMAGTSTLALMNSSLF